jgi:hypothetical protein
MAGRAAGYDALQAMLKQLAERMEAFKIGTKTGNPKYDDASLVAPMA